MTEKALDFLVHSKEGKKFIHALNWFQNNDLDPERKRELVQRMDAEIIKPLIEAFRTAENCDELKTLMQTLDMSFDSW